MGARGLAKQSKNCYKPTIAKRAAKPAAKRALRDEPYQQDSTVAHRTIKSPNKPLFHHDNLLVELSAVIVAITGNEPRVLVLPSGGDGPDALPSGHLESRHRTLEAGLRSWVEHQTLLSLGYVEQLYTFGDRNRAADASNKQQRVLSIGYLALAREARPMGATGALWRDWYRYFPWEDWRSGEPAVLERILRHLKRWIADSGSSAERRSREQRAGALFGLRQVPWSDERTLERYELLYELGLVAEAHRDRAPVWASPQDPIGEAAPMSADHRRILATAISRLRGKITYRPVVFELMPPRFTFLQLQLVVEALAGRRLHKSNFRRLVESEGLVEETGEISAGTAGRPARLMRFRPGVLLERPAPGVRLPASRAGTAANRAPK